MKLRRRFLSFAVIIHAILIVLSVFLLSYNKYLFLAAELMIITSIVVTYQLYKAFLKPLNLLAAGIESIKDRDFSTTFVDTGQEELDMLIGVYNRMIEQLRDERVKQREQHYFLQRLIEATPTGVIILDLDEKISLLNPAARTLLGVDPDEIIGCSLASLSDGRWSELTELRPGEARVISFSGTQTYRCRKSHFLDRGFHRHFILVEELTREIAFAQKRAYEKVIRMMSHEINNSVGAVNSILDSSLALRGQLSAEEREVFADAMRVAIERNEGLNRFMGKLADVVRIPPPSREPYDLHELLKSVQVLMGAECERRNIHWRWELAQTPLLVEIDVHQMEQVLVNVTKNAAEAIGRDGTLVVRTVAGNSRRLSIIDNGKGITDEARAHLFTPFFSTKRDGQGIGLTLTREILSNHGFGFGLHTPEDGLTEFWIEFTV